MTRPRLIAAAVLALALLVAGVLSARRAAASVRGIAVSGKTRVEIAVVAAPRLSGPALDASVGITRSKRSDIATPGPAAMLRAQMAAGAAKAKAGAAASSSRMPVASGMLAKVLVHHGDRVKKGQVLAVFDDTMLRLGVAYAEAADRKAGKTPDVLAQQAADLRDTRADVRSQGRAKLNDAQATLDSNRAKIESGVKQLPTLLAAQRKLAAALASSEAGSRQATAGLKQVESALAQAEEQLAAAERSAESSPAPPGIEHKIVQLKAQIAQLEAQAAQLRGTVTKLRGVIRALSVQRAKLDAAVAGIRKGQAALPQLYAAQDRLAAGREQLDAGIAKLNDGIQQLDAGSDLMRVFAQVPSAGVAAAEAALAQATLVAPCDGVVEAAMAPGEVPVVGAPVVFIRPAGGTLVDTYLTAEQLAGVRVGDSARVSLDSLPVPVTGRVEWVSGEQEFPPTGYPTQIVHLSSVVRVTVKVPDELPAGVPADVVIRP